jgi:hypothetical protein
VNIRKNKLKRRQKKYLISIIVIIFLFFSYRTLRINSQNKDIVWENYVLIGKRNLFIVYDKKLSIMLPMEVYLTKDMQFQNYIKEKRYADLLNVLNDVLPVKLENYMVVKKNSDIKIETEHQIIIPYIEKDGKKYILNSGLTEVFSKLYYDKEELNSIRPEEIIVDILNANGKTGYATTTGKKIQEELGFKYNAANYEELTEYTYIINNGLSEDILKKTLLLINEKYIKVKENTNLPTIANLVIILGKEQKNLLDIYVIRKDRYDEETYNLLKNKGYITTKRIKKDIDISDNVIEYNSEDYYTAYKLSKLLNIENLIENNELNNKINILLK